MSIRGKRRQAKRDMRPEAASSELLATYEISAVAKAFMQSIYETQNALAYLERRGIPSIYPSVFETGRDSEEKPMLGPLTGLDAQGRALMAKVVGGVVVHCYMRRTRRLALLTREDRARFIRVAKKHSRATAQSTPARKARAAFREAMEAAHRRDHSHG